MKKSKSAPKRCETDDPQQDLYHHTFKRIICIDVDGVLHQYSEGWKGPTDLYDPPVPGAIAWLRSLIEDERFQPVIYSSRSKHPEGPAAIRAWLVKHGLPEQEAAGLEFPIQKPAAWLIIDDRCFLFRGQWPSKEFMLEFMGWTKRLDLVKQVNGEDITDAEFLRRLGLKLTQQDLPGALEVVTRIGRIADELDGRRGV
jgi:hypothetical protein